MLEVVEDVVVPLQSVVPLLSDAVLPPTDNASLGRDESWRSPATPHELPYDFAEESGDQTPDCSTWI